MIYGLHKMAHFFLVPNEQSYCRPQMNKVTVNLKHNIRDYDPFHHPFTNRNIHALPCGH